jgi:hypothetical protein
MGNWVIERVEAEARHSPAFVSVLRGLWRQDMSQELWQRIELARGGQVL